MFIGKDIDETKRLVTTSMNIEINKYISDTIEELKANPIQNLDINDTTILNSFDINQESKINSVKDFFSGLLSKLKEIYKPEKTEEEKKNIIKVGRIINRVFNFLDGYFKDIEKTSDIIQKINGLWVPNTGIPALKKMKGATIQDSDYSNNLPKGYTIKGALPFISLFPGKIRLSASTNFLTKIESLFFIDSIIFPVIKSMKANAFKHEKNNFITLITNIVNNILTLANLGGADTEEYKKSIAIKALELLNSNEIFIIEPEEAPRQLETVDSSQPPQVTEPPVAQPVAQPVPPQPVTEPQPVPPQIQREQRFNEQILKSNHFLIKEYDGTLSDKISSFIKSLQSNKLVEWIGEMIQPSQGGQGGQGGSIDDIQNTSSEIQIFLKGFLGITTLIHHYSDTMGKTSDGKQKKRHIPTIITKITGTKFPNQGEMFSKFTETTEALFFNDTVNFINELITLSKKRGDKTKKLKQLEQDFRASVPEYNEYLELFNKGEIHILEMALKNINEFEGYNHEEEETYGSDVYLSINPFFGVIERNKIGFDKKELTDEYLGYNANEFNFNMLLLSYFDFKLYKEESQYVGYENLFNQLFSDSDLFYVSRGSRGGGTEENSVVNLPDNISTTIDYFFGTDDSKKQNNEMKTTLEILINPPKKNILSELKDIMKGDKGKILSLSNKYPLLYVIYPSILGTAPIKDRNGLSNIIRYRNIVKRQTIDPEKIMYKVKTPNILSAEQAREKGIYTYSTGEPGNQVKSSTNTPVLRIRAGSGKRTRRQRKKNTKRKYKRTNHTKTRRFRKTRKY